MMVAMWLLTALLALPSWSEPTAAEQLEGMLTFYAPGTMERVAEYRGYGGPLEPVALMACGDLGRDVWLQIGDAWIEAHVVDCACRSHYADRLAEGKVAEVSWSLWADLGLPLAPVPVVVLFDSPPAVRWR